MMYNNLVNEIHKTINLLLRLLIYASIIILLYNPILIFHFKIPIKYQFSKFEIKQVLKLI